MPFQMQISAFPQTKETNAFFKKKMKLIVFVPKNAKKTTGIGVSLFVCFPSPSTPPIFVGRPGHCRAIPFRPTTKNLSPHPHDYCVIFLCVCVPVEVWRFPLAVVVNRPKVFSFPLNGWLAACCSGASGSAGSGCCQAAGG